MRGSVGPQDRVSSRGARAHRGDPSDLALRFGPEVAALVAAVTQQPSIRSYRQRKAELRKRATGSGEPAAVLFAADKIGKVREYREQLARSIHGGNPPRRRRLHHYTESLLSLEAVIPDHPLVGELRSELTQLTPLPAPKGEAIAEEKAARGE
jgi:hypothetical protein